MVVPSTYSSPIRKTALAAETIEGRFAARKSRESRPSHRALGRIEGSMATEAFAGWMDSVRRDVLAGPVIWPSQHAAGMRARKVEKTVSSFGTREFSGPVKN